MALSRYTFPTAEAAAADLAADGWAFREAPTLGDYWAKPSRVDPICGGYERAALVTVERRDVAP